jgi:hypothetical protein
MNTYGGVEVWLHRSLPWQYMEVSGQLRAQSSLRPEKNRLYPLDRKIVCTRAAQDAVEKRRLRDPTGN